jgi:hypothetical protein
LLSKPHKKKKFSLNFPSPHPQKKKKNILVSSPTPPHLLGGSGNEKNFQIILNKASNFYKKKLF